ncbi:hypothetical protein [Pseudomonas alkylphenolica]|uniref:Uncharacterized protein n=1 Tax=Pseudomonas alkylphenolica TaxID=237609 RepID=A0A077F4Q9_9PSED|nr:hypothetical protein [Pseudomonas alkylphenolica]AIL60472.1 hypothetical protein PSAKL28_12460 [Pseudomonas alkylphenolica]
MRFNNILSADLPEIDETIKECVNGGQWLLFKSDSISRSEVPADFYLKVGQSVYALDGEGHIVGELDRPNDNFRIDELYYFSDLPKPRSISNAISSKVF